jgi:hypothetical protein
MGIFDIFRKKEKCYITCGKCNLTRESDYLPRSDFYCLRHGGGLSKDRCPACNYCGGIVGPYPPKETKRRRKR